MKCAQMIVRLLQEQSLLAVSFMWYTVVGGWFLLYFQHYGGRFLRMSQCLEPKKEG